jgi:hypothetical protein
MKPGPQILYVSWQDEESRKIIPIARLLRTATGYEFSYIKAAEEARTLGFEPLLSFPQLEGVYRSETLPPLFENRVMPRSREDFPAHVAELDLVAEQAEPFTVLARTGGKRVTDRLEVFTPPVVCSDRVEGVFLARGIRHVPGAETAVAALHSNDRLRVVADAQNEANKLALALQTERSELVGYVPDYLACEIGRVDALSSLLQVFALKVNPDPAPVHHRLLCRYEYPVSKGGSDLFHGPRFSPLSPEAIQAA